MSGPVVVTGAASGIGRATALRLLRAGRPVVGLDLDRDGLAQIAVSAGADFVPVVGDAGSWDVLDMCATTARDQLGGLSGWVNNAARDVLGAAHDSGPEAIRAGVEANLCTPLLGMAVAVRHFLTLGGGAMVNIGSIQGRVAFPGYLTYQASKAAIEMATRGVASDYAGSGIRANVVLPGTIATPMTDHGRPSGTEPDQWLAEMASIIPMARVGTADEVAAVIVFLLGEESSYVTGASVVVDGGSLTRCVSFPAGD